MTDERVDLDAYLAETTTNDTARLLTRDGSPLAGYPNGENRRWYVKALLIHVALTGRGAGSGTAVAACNQYQEVGYDGQGLVPAASVAEDARCRRPACWSRWTET